MYYIIDINTLIAFSKLSGRELSLTFSIMISVLKLMNDSLTVNPGKSILKHY